MRGDIKLLAKCCKTPNTVKSDISLPGRLIQTYLLKQQRKIQYRSFRKAFATLRKRSTKEKLFSDQRLLDMLKELTFMGVAITSGASGESLTANLSCMKRLSTMESSLRTIL